MQIRQQLVASRAKTSKGVNPVAYITIHETANTNAGANAAAHANLQSKGNVRSASWHYSVDDREVVQSFPDEVRCWHAGDGGGHGNMSSIGIEICVNRDGDFAAAVANAVILVRTLMERHHVSIDRVVQHNHWSGKNCPTNLRSGARGISWSQFIAAVASGGDVASGSTSTSAGVVTGSKEADIMAALPNLDWRKQNATYSADDARVQGLLAADGTYTGKIDGLRGPKSVAALDASQIKHNCGGPGKTPDRLIGLKTWGSLLSGKVW